MYFLVDFENVKNLGLRGTDALEPEDGLVIFFSETSSRVERRYLEEIERSGCTFEVCKLVKPYKNALDFYIAAKSGEIFGGGYKGTIAIISKDEGLKAVRDYWTHRAKPSHHMVVCESVERAILAAGGPYDPATQHPAIRQSICTGEMVGGIMDDRSGEIPRVHANTGSAGSRGVRRARRHGAGSAQSLLLRGMKTKAQSQNLWDLGLSLINHEKKSTNRDL